MKKQTAAPSFIKRVRRKLGRHTKHQNKHRKHKPYRAQGR